VKGEHSHNTTTPLSAKPMKNENKKYLLNYAFQSFPFSPILATLHFFYTITTHSLKNKGM